MSYRTKCTWRLTEQRGTCYVCSHSKLNPLCQLTPLLEQFEPSDVQMNVTFCRHNLKSSLSWTRTKGGVGLKAIPSLCTIAEGLINAQISDLYRLNQIW